MVEILKSEDFNKTEIKTQQQMSHKQQNTDRIWIMDTTKYIKIWIMDLEVEIMRKQLQTVLCRLAPSGLISKHFLSKLWTIAKRDLFSWKSNYDETIYYYMNAHQYGTFLETRLIGSRAEFKPRTFRSRGARSAIWAAMLQCSTHLIWILDY